MERLVYRRAERVVVLSGAFGRLVSERYGVEPAKVVVIPPAVDLELFEPGSRSEARARLAIDADAFVVVAARRLEHRMGLEDLLRAWQVAQDGRPDALLLIAGTGSDRERLEAMRLELRDPDSVRLVGRLSDDDLVALYRAADCSVVPSRALEGFGLVVLESLGCGTPAIVTDVGGLADGVAGLDGSLVVPPHDPKALAVRLLAAAGGDLPDREACRAHAETFSWDVVARRHVELYREVVSPDHHRPRVVYVDHCAQRSGGELALVRLLPALDADAHVILAEDGPLVGMLRDAGATVEILAMRESTRGLGRQDVSTRRIPLRSAVSTLAYCLKLARRIRSLRPDIVHTNSLKAALYGGVAGRLAAVPVVWHIRDRIAPDYLPPFAVHLVRLAARVLPTATIANSESTLETVRLPRTLNTVAVPSPHGYRRRPRPPCAQRRDADAFCVGMVGRLAPWKGQHVFLDAFAHAFPDGEATAVIVGTAMFGEDAYGDQLEDQVVRLGLGDRVEFTGFTDDVEAQLERFDVLVHASVTPEPFGQVVVEGMAAGVPVVAANAGGPAETITDGVNGLLYPMGDVDALAGHLRRLADDPELRLHLAQGGLLRAVDFSPERIAPAVLEVYRRALSRHGGRSRRRPPQR